MSCFDFVTRQEVAERSRRALVEKDLHLRIRQCALRGVLQDRVNLLRSGPFEPFDEVVDRGSIFQVLEQRGDRHSRTAKDPCATHTLGIAFDSGAGVPVDHGNDGSSEGGT